MSAITAIALAFVVSLLLNCALIGWVMWRGQAENGSRVVLWAGNGWVSKPVKPGAKRYVWERPDKTKLAIPLLDEFGQRWNRRGTVWFANGMTGQLARYSLEKQKWVAVEGPDNRGEVASTGWLAALKNLVWKPVEEVPTDEFQDGSLLQISWTAKTLYPDGNKFAEVIDDERERKWFEAQKEADRPAAKTNVLVLLAVVGVAIWLFTSGGL